MPWVILLAPRLSTSRLYSDWPIMSMKPGATTSPAASTLRFAVAPSSLPTAAILSPTTQTSALNQGAPEPSTTRPPANSRSPVKGLAGAAATAMAAANTRASATRGRGYLIERKPPATRILQEPVGAARDRLVPSFRELRDPQIRQPFPDGEEQPSTVRGERDT